MARLVVLAQSANCQPDSPALEIGETSMKNIRTLLTIVLLLAATVVCAQTQERPMLKATVPFAFTVENINFPAGSYIVSALPPLAMTIKLKSADGRKAVFIRALPGEGSTDATARLVFIHIDNEYFLSQAWEERSKTHSEFFLGNRAKELAKNHTGEQVNKLVAVAGH
jgi:hypothetical protein